MQTSDALSDGDHAKKNPSQPDLRVLTFHLDGEVDDYIPLFTQIIFFLISKCISKRIKNLSQYGTIREFSPKNKKRKIVCCPQVVILHQCNGKKYHIICYRLIDCYKLLFLCNNDETCSALCERKTSQMNLLLIILHDNRALGRENLFPLRLNLHFKALTRL